MPSGPVGESGRGRKNGFDDSAGMRNGPAEVICDVPVEAVERSARHCPVIGLFRLGRRRYRWLSESASPSVLGDDMVEKKSI